ncbi:MAG TPA: helix-turn-helix domain-containing protein [Sedimentisphaerales bacterium]
MKKISRAPAKEKRGYNGNETSKMVSSQNLLWLAAVWFCAMNALINAAWDAECDEPSDKLVLVYLADRANTVSRAWPHMKTIIRDTGLTRAPTAKRGRNNALHAPREPHWCATCGYC